MRPAREAGLHVEPAALPGRVALDLVGERRARPDHAHVAAQDVPELGQLVHRGAPDQPANARDPRVALVDGVARSLALGADLHRAELQQLELLAAQADALLAIEDGASVLEPDRDRGGREQRAREQQAGTGEGDVERAVHAPSITAAMRGELPLHADGDISVAIVAYRTPEVLAECLASFERHRPARVTEVIVVDNSADGSVAPVAGRFPWIEYVGNAENLHFRKAANQAARRARGRYLLLLNPDAYLTDGRAPAQLAEVLDRDPTVGLVGPMIRGDDGLLAPQGERLPGIADLLAQKLYVNTVWPRNPLARRHARVGVSREASGPVETLAAAALMCRREEFLRVGGFDERAAAYWEEPEMARKLRRLGLRAYYLADAFVYHRWRQGGGLLETQAQRDAHFRVSTRLYYREFYGPAGGLLFDALEGLQQIARRLRRAFA